MAGTQTVSKRKTTTSTTAGLAHLAIECVSPQLDGGRFFVKRVLGDVLVIEADVLKDGHDVLAARARVMPPGDREWHATPMHYDVDHDRWSARVPLDRIGMWRYTVDAWTDRFATWRSGIEKKVAVGQDVRVELLEGVEMLDAALRRARGSDARRALQSAIERMRDDTLSQPVRAALAADPTLLALAEEHLPRPDLTSFPRELSVWVDRARAAFAAWYEMFPRSQTTDPARHGTFATAEQALPRIAALGFDIVYLPPIHPIGTTARKGKNGALAAEPDDIGSPWAIGNADGGHCAIDPRLGTLADFDRFVRAAKRLGLEVALDYALQCSPDHPWVHEHPEWFFIRPDGTIQYAENPPKKYQDIYPLNFWCEEREQLWAACLEIVRFWVSHGVLTFRVDNPHTKPFAFWEWLIDQVHREHPDVVFLSEAFTRPKRLKHLAKLGFTQSYTYFTWKNTSWELRDWWAEMHTPEALEYLRGNLFTNTPDILTEYLQTGGRPAFRVRLLLAATMSPLYGIYSGFELLEREPRSPGSEEYLDSEKYQLRPRDWSVPGNLDDDLARLNRLRREQPALQRFGNLSFHATENEQILCFTKTTDDHLADVIVIANLDPAHVQETFVHVPLALLDLPPEGAYLVDDLLTGARYAWRGERNYVRLDPAESVGHVLLVRREGV